jgi:hypothetical protein
MDGEDATAAAGATLTPSGGSDASVAQMEQSGASAAAAEAAPQDTEQDIAPVKRPASDVAAAMQAADGQPPPPQKRAKRKHRRKDPHAPKKPRAAFVYFCELQRPHVVSANPGIAANDVTRRCSERWRNMTTEEKAAYQALADQDRERYSAELALYVPPPPPASGDSEVGSADDAAARRASAAVARMAERQAARAELEQGCALAPPAGDDDTTEDEMRCEALLRAISLTPLEPSPVIEGGGGGGGAVAAAETAPDAPSPAVASGSCPQLVDPSIDVKPGPMDFEGVLEVVRGARGGYATAHQFAQDVRQVLVRRQHHIANRAGTPLEVREKACAAERVQSRKFERLLRQWLLLLPPERPPVERLIDEAPPEATAVAGAVHRCQLCETPQVGFAALPPMWTCGSCTTQQADFIAQFRSICTFCEGSKTSVAVCRHQRGHVGPDAVSHTSKKRKMEGLGLSNGQNPGAEEQKQKQKKTRKPRQRSSDKPKPVYLRNEDGKFVCDGCSRLFATSSALTGHITKGCDMGEWRCAWCNCEAKGSTGKAPGPAGSSTLCSTCGSRFRAGATGPPNIQGGKYVCNTCGKLCDSALSLGGHLRFCDGGKWRCSWCNCPASAAGGKVAGPDGEASLCAACGSRYRSNCTDGEFQHATTDKHGRFVCDRGCGKTFETIVGLSSHQRTCIGDGWRCRWCLCRSASPSTRAAGPDGSGTLCADCGSRFRQGVKGPPGALEGKYACPRCGKEFDSLVGLGGHHRFCDGGLWRCAWCECQASEAQGKAAGPDGAATLCSACGVRFRDGALGPPLQDRDGRYVCDHCNGRFETLAGVSYHRHSCPLAVNVSSNRGDSTNARDDIDVLSTLLLTKTNGLQDSSTGQPHIWQTPPPHSTSDGPIPAARIPDIVALVDFFETFASALKCPAVTRKDTIHMVTSNTRLQLVETICVQLTRYIVELSQSAPMPCGPTYFRYEPEHFYGMDAVTLLKSCLDFATWEAVLYAYCSNHVARMPCTAEVHRTIQLLLDRGFSGLDIDGRFVVLNFLTAEILGSSHCRDAMDANLVLIDAKDMEGKASSERRLKEDTDWTKEKTKRAPTAYNLFLQDELAKHKAANPSKTHKDSFSACALKWKTLPSNEIAQWVNKAKFTTDTSDKDLQEIQAVINEIVRGVVDCIQEEDQDRLRREVARLTVRMEPVGIDRFYNRYWWSAAYPERLWLEQRPVATAHFQLPQVRGFMETESASLQRRVSAANSRVSAAIAGIDSDLLRQIVSQLGVTGQDEAPPEELVRHLVQVDPSGQMRERLLRHVRAELTERHALGMSPEELQPWCLIFNAPLSQDDSSVTHAARVEILLSLDGAMERLSAEFEGIEPPESFVGVHRPSEETIAFEAAAISEAKATKNAAVVLPETGNTGIQSDITASNSSQELFGSGRATTVTTGVPKGVFSATMATVSLIPPKLGFKKPVPGSAQQLYSHTLYRPAWMTQYIEPSPSAAQSSTAKESPPKPPDPAAVSLMQLLEGIGGDLHTSGSDTDMDDSTVSTEDREHEKTPAQIKADNIAARGKKWEDMANAWQAPVSLSAIPVQPPSASSYWGEDGMVKAERWRCYSTPQQLEGLLAHLNPQGVREQALHAKLRKLVPRLRKEAQAQPQSSKVRAPSHTGSMRSGGQSSRAALQSDVAKITAAREAMLQIFDSVVETASGWFSQWPAGWTSVQSSVSSSRRWDKLVPTAQLLASVVCKVGKAISESAVDITVEVAAPVQEWRKKGGPDKLGRSSSRTAGLKNVHDPKGWEGWLRRWQAASRDVNGTSLLCLLVYALRSRARLLIGKVRTGIDHNKK